MNENRIDSRNIKMHNRGMVYNYIWKNGPVSKQDIVSDLRISLPTVTQNLNFLEERGLIDASLQIRNTGGRNATAYRINAGARYAIGVNLTRNHMNAVSVNMLGEVGSVLRRSIPIDLDSEEYLRQLGDMVEEVIDRDGIDRDRILRVGISLPGIVDADRSVVLYGRTHDFTGKTVQEIGQFIPYPAALFHDSYTAAYAEQSESGDLGDAFYLGLSNTVAGGLICQGEIYEGENQRAGDVCHMILDIHSKRRCYCGNCGCTDIFLSANELDSYTDGNLAEYFSLLKAGDEEAKSRWDTYLDYLALTIHNVRMLFDTKVVLGGYVGVYMDDYMEEICRRVDEKDPFGARAGDYVMPCTARIEPIAVGSARVIVDEFLNGISSME